MLTSIVRAYGHHTSAPLLEVDQLSTLDARSLAGVRWTLAAGFEVQLPRGKPDEEGYREPNDAATRAAVPSTNGDGDGDDDGTAIATSIQLSGMGSRGRILWTAIGRERDDYRARCSHKEDEANSLQT
jgi:hypothetical protein